MTDLERMIIATSIACGIFLVVYVAFLLWLPHAAPPLRDRIVARFRRWNEVMEIALEKGTYAWAVVTVVFAALTLIGAVAYLFVPH